MKILNVNMSIDPVTGGGTAERTLQMSIHLAKKGMKCSILTTDTGLSPEYIQDIGRKGVDIYALRVINSRFYLPEYGSSKTINNIVQQSDIIHIMNHWTILNALVFNSIRKLSKPYVVCPAGALNIYGRSKISKTVYNRLIGRRIIRNAERQIAVTDDEINQFISYGVDPSSINVIPNGINEDDFHETEVIEFRENHDLKNNPFIMFIGRLNHIKGPDLLLRAFCNVKDKLDGYHLVFAGPDGGLLSELKSISGGSDAGKRVHFIGYIGGKEKSRAYHAADLVVIPSRQEAMSIVLLEGGITKTPVLITDKCGFNEISDIDGGMVVEATIEGLEKGLVEMLKDSSVMEERGRNLYKYTHHNFIWDKIVDKYINLYQEIIS
jgi:glycosyltransferase involved in cell wall biosynthesis